MSGSFVFDVASPTAAGLEGEFGLLRPRSTLTRSSAEGKFIVSVEHENSAVMLVG
jgi:hypothetical protein